jgi:hypothetical protein
LSPHPEERLKGESRRIPGVMIATPHAEKAARTSSLSRDFWRREDYGFMIAHKADGADHFGLRAPQSQSRTRVWTLNLSHLSEAHVAANVAPGRGNAKPVSTAVRRLRLDPTFISARPARSNDPPAQGTEAEAAASAEARGPTPAEAAESGLRNIAA